MLSPNTNRPTGIATSNMGDHDEEMPRAKRLKMLREAKERKERLERGEPVDDEPTADVPMDKRGEEEVEEEEEDNVAEGEQLIKAIDSQMADDRDDEKNDNDEEEDILNLAPKRANWDIERDIAPMLKKLERRTQHAIVEILREKMAAEQQEEGEDEDEEDEEEEEEENEE